VRKVIQITNSVDAKGAGWLVVLCDDGTLWEWGSGIQGWQELPDIPQPKNTEEVDE
jgi:hypothetical protein